MLRARGRSNDRNPGRGAQRARAVDPEQQTTPAISGGVSYSVRICGRCRKPAESDGTGGIRCPTCGRSRGWL